LSAFRDEFVVRVTGSEETEKPSLENKMTYIINYSGAVCTLHSTQTGQMC